MLNESAVIERGGERLHLGGIDDAHFYEMDTSRRRPTRYPTMV